MTFRTLHRFAFAFALLALLAIGASAQDKMNKMDSMNKMSSAKPTVALIRADWCGACQKLEPTMTKLMEEYGGRLNFVVLDVSNDEKTAASAVTARKLGLGKFFDANKKKTSTVAVFDAKNKLLSMTHYSRNKEMAFDRETYVRAFDEAIAKG